MLKLYAISGTCSLASHIVLELTGAPFELRLLDVRQGENRQPWYLAINPAGRVPALQDGDDSIVENVAIQAYLADKFPTLGLAPAGAVQRAHWLGFLAWLSNAVHPSYRQFRRPELFSADRSADGGLKNMGQREFLRHLELIDALLADQKWIFGDQFTTADPYAHVFFRWAVISRFEVNHLEHLKRHTRDFLSFPAVLSAYAREGLRTDELLAQLQ